MTFHPACDCHAHVFDPERHAWAPGRAYTPGPAPVGALRDQLDALGMARVVLVQPSVYGVDNRCLLDALGRLGPTEARGVAVLDTAHVSDAEIDDLHVAGVRGIRLNLQVSGGGLDAARRQLRQARPLLARHGWSLQVHAALAVVVALLDDLRTLGAPVVLDHHAGGVTESPQGEDHLATLLQAMAQDPLYLKLSAPYRLPGTAEAQTRQARRLARAFTDAAPDRVLWGSDWPHTGGSGNRGGDAPVFEPFRSVDSRQVLDAVLTALPDDATRQRLLVDNPAALYGFDA